MANGEVRGVVISVVVFARARLDCNRFAGSH